MVKYIVKLLFAFSVVIAAQTQSDEYVTVTGDSLVGKIINGESVREVYGNVILTQGNIHITCNKAVQFILRNDAELIGNVVVRQENLTITTERGFYYGNLQKAETKSKVKLDDKKVILIADIGDYYFKEDRAYFQDNVILYDTVSTLTADALNYYKNQDRAVAVGNVKIVDAENIITADTLEHFRNSRITFADHHVTISNNKNNIVIWGNHLEDYAQKKYTIISENPVLIQIDSSYNGTNADKLVGSKKLVIDTLIINSLMMEAYRDTSNIFIAKDSVQIVRGEFASKNAFTIYYKDDEKIMTRKENEQAQQPVLWYENSQITGDSVTIYLREGEIRLVEINQNSFTHSHHENYPNRFDQVSGEKIIVDFLEGEIYKTEIFGSVFAIYYMYDEDVPNGLTKSSSETAEIKFEDKKVSEVRLFGLPTSDYYPEKMVEGKENEFLLPKFSIMLNRPEKQELLKSISYLSKENL